MQAEAEADTVPGRSEAGFRSWLKTVIPNIGAPETLIDAAADAPVDHRNQAIGANQAPSASAARKRAYPSSADSPTPADHDLAALCGRLDMITRRLGRLVAHVAGEPSTPGTPAAAGENALTSAIAEIAARQRVLDDGGRAVSGMFSPPPGSPGPAPASAPTAPSPDLGGLEHQLKLITTQLELLRSPSRADEILTELREQLKGISTVLENFVPRSAFEALEGEVRALGARLDQTRSTTADGDAFLALEHGLGEIRDALRGLAPGELDQAVRTLLRKIDHITESEPDPVMFQQLDAAVAALRGIVAQVASGEALAGLVKEVRALSDKIEQSATVSTDPNALHILEQQIKGIADTLGTRPAVPHHSPAPTIEPLIEQLSQKLDRFDLSATEETVFEPIKQHIDELGDKIERLQSSPDPSALVTLEQRLDFLADTITRLRPPEAQSEALTGIEERLRGLAERLDRLDEHKWERPDIGPLEQRIAQLSERLIASEARLGTLQAIERGIADLLAHLDEKRKSRTVNDRSADAPAATAGPGMRPTDDAEQSASDEKAEAELGDPRTSVAVVPAAQAAASSSAYSPSAPPSSLGEPAAGEAKPPPDQPIEPGSGPPHGFAKRSMADHIAASRTAREATSAGEAEPSSSRPNFIVAARRAAQAASEQHSQSVASAGTTADNVHGTAKKLADRVRSLFVSSSVVLIGLGVAGMALSSADLLGDRGSRRAEQTTPLSIMQADATATPDAEASPAATKVSATLGLPPPFSSSMPPRTRPPALTAKPPASFATASAAPAPAALDDAPSRKRNPARMAAIDTTGSIKPARPLAPKPTEEAAPSFGPAWSETLPQRLATGPLVAGIAAGNPAAAYEIALRYAEGRGIGVDIAAAAVWLKRAAERGLAPAQFRLGNMYEKGLGVKKDLKEARRLYLAAAAQGNAKAMHNVAVLLAEGIDGRPDFPAAVEWFKKAAKSGVADSQYNVAVLYARGIGVEQDLIEGFKWFAIAAEKGDRDAASKRDDIAARLDQPSLAAARLAATGFVPKPQPDEAMTAKAPPGGWDDEAPDRP